MRKNTSAVTVAVMNSSDTNMTPVTRPSVRSRNRYVMPSRARSGGPPSGTAAGGRRACSSNAAAATAANVPAFTSIATSAPPSPASRPPSGGPAVIPA